MSLPRTRLRNRVSPPQDILSNREDIRVLLDINSLLLQELRILRCPRKDSPRTSSPLLDRIRSRHILSSRLQDTPLSSNISSMLLSPLRDRIPSKLPRLLHLPLLLPLLPLARTPSKLPRLLLLPLLLLPLHLPRTR